MGVIQAMVNASDEELVSAARAGERGALGALADRHFGMVYAIGLARLGNRDQAEDLAQEVFLRAFLLLDQLDSRALFSHWLSRIARNLAIDWQRRGERASRLIPMVPLEEIPVEILDEKAVDPRTEAASAEQYAALRQALEHLPPDAREVVLLHYMEGLSQHEISRRLGVNHSTVSRGITRSLAAMRTAMESTMHSMARGLGARPSAKARSVAIAVAVLTLPAATRAGLAAVASQSLQAGASATSGKAAGAAIGSVPAFINASLSLLKTGGALMGYGKAATAAAVALAISGGGYYYYNESQAAPVAQSPAAATSINSTDPALFKLALAEGKRVVLRTERAVTSSYELPKELQARIDAMAKKDGSGFPGKTSTHIIEDVAITGLGPRTGGQRALEFETVGMLMTMDIGLEKMSGAAGTAMDRYVAPTGGKNDPLDLTSSIGKKLVALVDSKGEITKLEGLDPEATKNRAGHSAEMAEFIAAGNSEEVVKNKLQALLAPTAPGAVPVKAGTEWKTDVIPGGNVLPSARSESTCRFTGWKMFEGRRVAEVTFTDGYSTTFNPAATPEPVIPMQPKIVAQTGTILFDAELGIIAQMDSKTHTESTMDIPVRGKAPQKMQLNATTVTRITQIKDGQSGRVLAATSPQ